MSDPLAIEVVNLGVNYGGRWVLRGLDMKIRPGETVALAGVSGSGKSTLLKCILGFAGPTEGFVRVFDHPVDGHGVWQARRCLAYVAQEPDLGAGTARQAIERPFTYKANMHLRHNLGRLPLLLERFNLESGILDKGVSSLSGGEKQRIALVSALLLDRPVILLDEVSSALDKANSRAVAEYFREVDDLTVLSVAHDSEWLGAPDHVMHLSGGALVKGVGQ